MSKRKPPRARFIRIPWNAKTLRCDRCGAEEPRQPNLLPFRLKTCTSCLKH